MKAIPFRARPWNSLASPAGQIALGIAIPCALVHTADAELHVAMTEGEQQPPGNGVGKKEVPALSTSSEVRLSREMRLIDITMIGVGSMIGAGIFVLTGIAPGVAGPALILVSFSTG